jgi:nucleotide-binding universal stress UspA family protein
LLGSVGHQVATHAAVPVVVVRGRTDGAEGPVVVGADGSPGGTHAVELGFAEAAERGCGVVAVRAYQPPAAPCVPGVQPIVYDTVRLEAAEQRRLDDTVALWRDKYPQVALRTVVAPGPAGRVLADLSRRAQLVVVGHRGHGSLAGTLLGSVGLQLLHHADCPILVARR